MARLAWLHILIKNICIYSMHAMMYLFRKGITKAWAGKIRGKYRWREREREVKTHVDTGLRGPPTLLSPGKHKARVCHVVLLLLLLLMGPVVVLMPVVVLLLLLSLPSSKSRATALARVQHWRRAWETLPSRNHKTRWKINNKAQQQHQQQQLQQQQQQQQ